MRSRKNSIDPRHIVRDVTEDLFNEGLLGYAKWLSMPKNSEWAQGVAKRALGASAAPAQHPRFEDWVLPYKDWKQGVGGRERVAMIQETVPEPFVGLRWKDRDKNRVIHTIKDGKAYIETEGSAFAEILDLSLVPEQIAVDTHKTYNLRYSTPLSTAEPAAPAASVGDYPWAKTARERGRIQKQLEKQIQHKGRIVTTKEYIDSLLSEGATPEILFEPTALTRASFNRMDGQAQTAWQRRQAEQGLKPRYLLAGKDGSTYSEINKTGFDYAYYTLGEPQVKVIYGRGFLDNQYFERAKKKTQKKYPQWIEKAPLPPVFRRKVGDSYEWVRRRDKQVIATAQSAWSGERWLWYISYLYYRGPSVGWEVGDDGVGAESTLAGADAGVDLHFADLEKTDDWGEGWSEEDKAVHSAEMGKSEYQPPTIQSKRGATVTFRRYEKYPNSGIFVIEGGSRPAVRGKSTDWHINVEKTTDLQDAKTLARAILRNSNLYRKAGGQAPMGAYRDVIDAVAALIVDISVNGLPEAPNA